MKQNWGLGKSVQHTLQVTSSARATIDNVGRFMNALLVVWSV